MRRAVDPMLIGATSKWKWKKTKMIRYVVTASEVTALKPIRSNGSKMSCSNGSTLG